MSTATPPRTGRWRVLLLAALAALAALLLGTATASAQAPSAAETRVGAIHPAVSTVVGVAEHIAAGQRQCRAPSQPQVVVGHCVAAEAGTSAAAKTGSAVETFLPGNNGFLGEATEQFLQVGQRIDRYGGSAYSKFFSPAGTPEAMRALPPGSAGQALRTFEVLKPFPVQAGTVAPAFGQLGLGTQFLTPVRLEILLKRGILGEVL